MSGVPPEPEPLSAGNLIKAQATPEHPWIGLAHFAGADHDYFYGRDAEVRELADRVRRASLTTLFSISGYGKSSIIGAGLIPALSVAGHRTVLLRRCYDDLATRSLHADVISACLSDMPGCVWDPNASSTLWEFFHFRAQPWFQSRASADNDDDGAQALAPWPVIIFDQFEEIFIKGEDRCLPDASPDTAARDAGHVFLTQLADLVENRPPAALVERLQSCQAGERRALVRSFDFQTRPVRVVIAVREDFLGRLERWRLAMPSLMEHRVELLLLSGPQALTAVFKPGTKRPDLPPIIPEDVAAAIVRVAAGAPSDALMEDIEAVPPILSLLCERLNERRLAKSPVPPTVTSGDFSPGEANSILGDFYDDKLRPHPVALRQYLEDKLVSESGFRENVILESAVGALRGSIPDVELRLRKLVDDRLLEIEPRNRHPRIEFTHDTLAKLALDSRKERQRLADEREQERERLETDRLNRIRRIRAIKLSCILGGVACVAVIVAGIAIHEWRIAQSRTKEALALVSFMNDQIGDFIDNVPSPLLERLNAKVDTFYKNHPALTPRDEHDRMAYHLRTARVHFKAVGLYQKGDYTPEQRKIFLNWEYNSIASELNEALRIGQILAENSPSDVSVTRDLILTNLYLERFYVITGESPRAQDHLARARMLLLTLLNGSPFSLDQWIRWMNLREVVDAIGPLPALPAHNIHPEQSPGGFDPLGRNSNTLGMRFITVPDTDVQFSVYQTRVEDFATFIQETGYVHMQETNDPSSRMWSVDRDGLKQRGKNWEDPGFSQKGNDPVVGVTWYDAKAFCEWLTTRERASGRLPAGWEYRLPTDAEWSIAVGLHEDPRLAPWQKDMKIREQFPWNFQLRPGQQVWPPPKGAGNYAGAEVDDGHWPITVLKPIPGYQDPFPRTAPVGSFSPNPYGIYDLGSNVCEWCEDMYGTGPAILPNNQKVADASIYRVLRGSNWGDMGHNLLLSSSRINCLPSARYDGYGFRCVLAPVSSAGSSN